MTCCSKLGDNGDARIANLLDEDLQRHWGELGCSSLKYVCNRFTHNNDSAAWKLLDIYPTLVLLQPFEHESKLEGSSLTKFYKNYCQPLTQGLFLKLLKPIVDHLVDNNVSVSVKTAGKSSFKKITEKSSQLCSHWLWTRIFANTFLRGDIAAFDPSTGSGQSVLSIRFISTCLSIDDNDMLEKQLSSGGDES
jgi:hypothetical protein